MYVAICCGAPQLAYLVYTRYHVTTAVSSLREHLPGHRISHTYNSRTLLYALYSVFDVVVTDGGDGSYNTAASEACVLIPRRNQRRHIFRQFSHSFPSYLEGEERHNKLSSRQQDITSLDIATHRLLCCVLPCR